MYKIKISPILSSKSTYLSISNPSLFTSLTNTFSSPNLLKESYEVSLITNLMPKNSLFKQPIKIKNIY